MWCGKCTAKIYIYFFFISNVCKSTRNLLLFFYCQRELKPKIPTVGKFSSSHHHLGVNLDHLKISTHPVCIFCLHHWVYIVSDWGSLAPCSLHIFLSFHLFSVWCSKKKVFTASFTCCEVEPQILFFYSFLLFGEEKKKRKVCDR